MAEVAKNYVKDIENKSELSQSVDKTQITDSFDFTQFNKDLESSFQKFLKETKSQYNDNFTRENMQLLFNDWLDKQLDTLDEFKNDEIEQAIIKPTVFELQKFDTLRQLDQIQAEIADWKQTTGESMVVTVNGSDLNIIPYKDGAWVVDKNEIAGLFSENFERKDELLGLLKSWTLDDVKKFQRIIAELNEDWSEDGTIWRLWSLWRTGVDWKFGWRTLVTFKNYVKNHKSSVDNPQWQSGQPGSVDNQWNWAWAGNPSAGPANAPAWAGNAPAGTTNTPAWTSNAPAGSPNAPTGTVPATHNPNNPSHTPDGTHVDAPQSGVNEYLERQYQMKSLYEWKWWETITIAKWLSLDSIKIVPEILGKSLTLKDDGNWNIVYTLPNENWEWTVSVQVWDKIATITIKSTKNNETVPGQSDILSQIDELELRQAITENRDIIPQKIAELKKEYNDIYSWNKQVDNPDKELKKIEAAMKKLLIAKECNKLDQYINQAIKGEKRWKDYLNNMIINGATIYIWWKYLSKEKFLQWVTSKKVDYIKKIIGKKRYMEVSIPDNFWNTDSTNCTITKLVLTDDESILKQNNDWNEEIQYDAYWYVDMKETEFDSTEKRAIKRLVRGLDKSLSIVDADYRKAWVEKTNLNKLRSGLIALINSESDIKDVFNFIADKTRDNFRWSKKDWKALLKDNYSDLKDAHAWNLAKLWVLYSEYKNNQNGKKMWDYFSKVMWLLENYFVRWVKQWWEDVDNFAGLYSNERIWVASAKLIDSDKQNKAINQLFSKKGPELLSLDLTFKNTPELTKLKNIVKKIDLSLFFAKPWVATVDHPNIDPELKKGSPEEKFNKEYKKYIKCLVDKKLDDNKKPNMVEGDGGYYNAVFDFLVWVWEARWDIVSAVNSLKLYDGDIDPDTLAQSGFKTAEEMRLVWMLSDINSDWRVDFADKWYKMWLEIKNIYKDAMVDKEYGVIDKLPMQNLIEYALKYAKKSWDTSTASKLETITSYEAADLLEWFRENPSIIKYLQNMLVNSPADLVDNIFKYWAGNEVESERADQSELSEITASQEAIQDIMNDEKFKAAFEREYQKLVEQWLKNTPEVKARFKPVVAAWMLANIADDYLNNYEWDDTKKAYVFKWTDHTQSKSWHPKLAVWWVLQTEKAGDFSLMLWVWASTDGSNVDLESVWLCIGWWDSWKVWKKQNTRISAWAGAWAEVSLSDLWTFIPLVSVWLEVSTLINEKRLQELKPRPATYLDIWWSIWLWLTSADPIPFGEVHVWVSRDKLEWINRTYNNIKEQLWWENWVIASVLSKINDFTQDETSIKNEIRGALVDKFYHGKEKPKDIDNLRLATDNIYRWLLYYMLWTNLADVTDDAQKKIIIKWIADNIAETYAVSRRNKSIQDLDWKVYLDKFAVWIIFLACYRTPMIWFSFSRYKWLYSSETETSQRDYQRQLRTEWNARQQWMDKDLWFYENDHITQKCVDYLNAKLQISNWKVEVPKILLKEVQNTSVEGSSLDTVIQLPWDLYKYVNINVNSKLKDYAQNDENGNVIVPANTQLTLLTSSKTDDGKFNLIIWDTKVNEDDIVIRPNQWLDWDAALYEWDMWEYILDVDVFNGMLEECFWWKESFPIEKCDKTMKIGDDDFAVLKLKSWVSMEDMWWTNSRTRVDKANWIVYAPQTGTLTVYQTVKGEYKLYYQSSPTDNLNINYEIEWQETITYTENSTEQNYSVSFNTTESLYWEDFVTELRSVLDGIKNSDIHNLLHEYRTNDWTLYTQFMDATCNVRDDGEVNESDYDDALNKLRAMLNNSSKFTKKYHWLDNLKTLVNRTDITLNQKVMIVDQCKMFFSYEANLTNWAWDWSDLMKLISNRWNVYETLRGYDKNTEFPLKWLNYRWKVVEQLKWKTNLSSDVVWNLVGMTAFYKRWKWTYVQMTEWRGYSMTEMWNTTPLWGVMVPIESTELAATKEWFWKNFDKADLHKNILVQTIMNNIKSLLSSNTDVDVSLITSAHIESILKWQNSIDIWWKNVKIDLDIDYVFYLLQECGNESIWIQLKWMEIKTGWVEIVQHINPANPEQSTATVKNTKRKWWFWIYTKAHVASNEQNLAHRWSFGIWLFGWAKHTTTDGNHYWSRPGPGDDPVEPGAWSNPSDNGEVGPRWGENPI